MNSLKIIPGDIAVDDRGKLIFVNDFDFKNIKRFYIVENHKQNFIRAWHGHKKEGKYVTCVDGTAMLAAIEIDNWDSPNKDLNINKFILSSLKPSILFIPPGFANGFMNLTYDSKLIFFSTSTLEESKVDDYRFDSHYWNAWDIIER
jgi:dTDP-4-dehydrorhamnose 3,5-epimerase-like enzyme